MQKFDLSLWLQDKSRKVVTRRGNPVRIICTDRKHGEDDLPIVFLEENNGGEFLLTCRNDGRCDNYDTQYDLFFADEEEELTELQKTLEEDCDCYVNLYNDGKTREELREWIKGWCHRIIDLARKELKKEFKDEEYFRLITEHYKQGKKEALKDLPKLEKTKDCIDPTIPVMYTCAASMKSYVEYHGYKLCINDVFEKLPKEE